MANRVELKDIKKAWKAASDIPKSQKSKKGKAYKYLRGLIGKLTPQQREALKNERAIKFAMGAEGKWWAKQADTPARTTRPASRQPTGAARSRPDKFDGSWGSGKFPIMAKVGHEDVDPYIVGKNGRPLSADQMPSDQQRKVISDLKYVGYRGPFVVNSAKRSFKELFNIMKRRKPNFNFLDLENPTINNIVESFLMRTNMDNYYTGVRDRSKPWKHNTYTNASGQDLSIPPVLRYRGNNWIQDFTKQLRDAGIENRHINKALNTMVKHRGLLGGFQSDHVKKGNKVDFYQNMFNRPGGDIMIQKLQDEKKWFVIPEIAPSSGNAVFDAHLGKSRGSNYEFGNPEDQHIKKGWVIKGWKPHKELDRDLTPELKKKYEKAADRWQEWNSSKKTSRNHPLVVEEAEKETTIETSEPPISQDDTISQEDATNINKEIDDMSPDIQDRPTHAAAVDTSPPLGTLDQPELEQLDKEATEEDYLPGKLPAPEVPPEQMPLDQPTPYGVYAKGQPEFAAAEEEQVLAAKDGVFVDKEKIEEEAEMGPIFPGQDPIVKQPVPYQDAPKAATGEAPITPEQFQAQPDQPVQPTQPQQVESVDEVVMEYVQEGKTSQGRNKLNQMVKEGKTTREEISETIKKYDKPVPQEPEDIMSAHARNMGKKPGPMMQKGLGLTEEEVVEVEKKKKVPIAPPPPKPDVVEESGFEKVIKSLKGEPSDIDEKKLYDPDSYAREMMEMDQKFQTDIKRALKDEAEADVEMQKIEPYRFWHSMSTPAKIVSALGALVAGYALPAEGAAAAYNMINAAIDQDVQSQKLDIDHAMRTRKEATRRATNAIERRAKIVGNPETRFKMMQISKNLKMNQAVKDKNDFKTRMKSRIMRNPAEAEQLFKYNPHMYQQIYTKDEIKHHRTVNENYKKALKDNNVSNVMNAANAMENTFMDMDWKKINGKMRLMKYDIAEPSGAGDMAMVFSFMKMLDPGSVVREGEFKTAAGMNPQYLFLARKWNKMAKGTMFTTSDRLSFVDAVNKVLKAKVQDANRVYKMYSKDLERQGYPSSFILGKPISTAATPSMKVNMLIKDIMDKKGVDRVEAIKLYKGARKRIEAKKRGVKFDKTGKPVRPEGEGKPLIGNKQFPIQSRIW